MRSAARPPTSSPSACATSSRPASCARRRARPARVGDAYELTALGRGLERPLLELGRWGLNFHDPATVAEMPPSMLPNALRVILQPPADGELTIGLRSGGQDYRLRIEDGWIEARRGDGRGRRPDPQRDALAR